VALLPDVLVVMIQKLLIAAAKVIDETFFVKGE
jgi:hypothetical protein